MVKSWLGFGDLDIIFKVTVGQTAKFIAKSYLMNWLADFNQICMDIIFGHDEELIRFW